MWRALKTFDSTRGALPAWLTYKAINRMYTCITSRAWLGRPARKMGQTPVIAMAEVSVPFDSFLWEILIAPDIIDDVILAYHHGEILAAINALSPAQQRYVYLRFWGGYTKPDMIAEFGYDPQGLWSSPRNGAKKKLREKLRHLVEV